jgi:hypothetical protein
MAASTIACLLLGCSTRADQMSNIQVVVREGGTRQDIATGPSLAHDFGVVLAGQSRTHKFNVRNSSGVRWTFAKIITTCACSVSKVSAPFIDPGKDESVEVTYRAPEQSKDFRHQVTVQFAESAAPALQLEIKGHVREPITAMPGEVNLGRVGKRHTPEAVLKVLNYSDHEFAPSATCSADWLSVGLTPIAGEPQARLKQSWRLQIKASPATLPPGHHRAEVRVHAGRPGGPSKAIPVDVLVTDDVAAIPASMFFGSVPEGGKADYRVMLRFTTAVRPAGNDDIRITHDLGSQLSLRCEPQSADVWIIHATLTPAQRDEFVEGTVNVAFAPQLGLSELTIPVRARALWAAK